MTDRNSYFKKGIFIILIPLFLILLPFLIDSLNRKEAWLYSQLIVTALFLSFFFSLVIGHFCKKKSTLRPAYLALVSLLSTLLCLISVEIFLRFKYGNPFDRWYGKWGNKKSLILGFEAKANHEWKTGPVTYSTDVHGFRRNLNDQKINHLDTNNIFVLGGSSAFGFGLNNNETWPYLLEKYLLSTNKNLNIRVINAANNGFNSLQALLRFYLEVLPLHPKYIIFYESINDTYDLRQRKNTHLPIEEEAFLSDSYAEYVSKKYKNLYEKTVLAYGIRNKLESIFYKREAKNPMTKEQEELIQSNGKIYIGNVKTLADICKANNIKLVLATFIHNKKKMESIDQRHIFVSNSINYHNDLLRELAREKNILLVDLEEDFKKMSHEEDYFFGDHYHPSQKGADFIARNIAEKIAEKLNSSSFNASE